LIGLAILPRAARAADEPLTLDEAITLAFANNERSFKAPQRVEAAVGGLDRARTAFFPTIVGQGVGLGSSVADKNGRHFSGDGLVSPVARE
jgi:outer membrane protein TolC